MNLHKNKLWTFVMVLLMLAALGIGSVPKEASAHASLIKAIPDADSRLQESPQAITLTFNERLEKGIFYIKVYNQKGDEVTKEPAQLLEQQTVMEVKLPKLGEGIYLVSYHVISADGHPVSGSYPITIGNPPQEAGAAPAKTSPVLDPHDHEGAGAFSVSMIIQYLSRGLWYLSMLALAGWTAWLRLPSTGGERVRKELQPWTQNLLRAHVIALLVLIFTHIEDLLGNVNTDQVLDFFLATSIGMNWIALLAMALLGFVLLQRFAWLDIIWAIGLLAIKSLNGHAVAFSPEEVTVLLDFVHLAASALWVGGLLVLAALWKKEDVSAFLKAFSNWALASMIMLALTGTALVSLFLPNIKYLTYSQWGIFLLVKIGVVLLVVVAGGLLRLSMRKQREQNIRKWFKIDFSLMLVIMTLAGIISYMSPIPANKPLNWHVMGVTIHMTAEIVPKVQGTNTFITKVWLPEELGKPKQVQMILKYEDDKEIAPIEVPLVPYEDKAEAESFGFVQYNYKTEGAYLPLRGRWTLEVRVMDLQDNEKVFNERFILY